MKKKIAIDIDGVICSSLSSDYTKSQPNNKAIKKINSLHAKGHEIIIFTARFMGRTSNNIEKAYSLGYKFTENQLLSWGLKFDKLIMGKPDFDILIDDKAFNYDEKWMENIF